MHYKIDFMTLSKAFDKENPDYKLYTKRSKFTRTNGMI